MLYVGIDWASDHQPRSRNDSPVFGSKMDQDPVCSVDNWPSLRRTTAH